MSKCPYNESIDCDLAQRDAEKKRQLNITLLSGGWWINPGVAKIGCAVKPAMCARLCAQRQR